MNKYTETEKKPHHGACRVLVALAFLAGSAPGASGQTMGATLIGFNILSKTAISLTGFSPVQTLVVSVGGSAPGIARAFTNASITTDHLNDVTAVTGQAEALALYNSLTAPAGATFIAMGGSVPVVLNPGPGTTVYQAAGPVTNNTTVTTINGSASSIVIFQVPTALSMTDANIILAGGILSSNVYWQVVQGVTVVNDDAVTRTFPGTVVNNTPAAGISLTCSGAGSLTIGRQASIGGFVTLTQSGAGVMTVAFPTVAGGGGGGGPAVPGCTDGYFYPSPATGGKGTFTYCMEQAGTAQIRVYNVIGDLAAKIDETWPAGQQLSTLNTGRLAPGVYLYLLERDYVGGTKARSGVKKFVVKH